ncbi:MAG TPA: hypothetical protein VFH58_14465 [Acidimicrobiales bacterium]|nr:hypothetical protein [Acidimicrobiales bacterium]
MTGRERCDEILRLIDQALAESEVMGTALPQGAVLRQNRRATERLAQAVSP